MEDSFEAHRLNMGIHSVLITRMSAGTRSSWGGRGKGSLPDCGKGSAEQKSAAVTVAKQLPLRSLCDVVLGVVVLSAFY